jgi:hypothetical protein
MMLGVTTSSAMLVELGVGTGVDGAEVTDVGVAEGVGVSTAETGLASANVSAADSRAAVVVTLVRDAPVDLLFAPRMVFPS